MSQPKQIASLTRRIHKLLKPEPCSGSVRGVVLLLVTFFVAAGTAQAGTVVIANVQPPAAIIDSRILTSDWIYHAHESQASVVTLSCPVFSQEQQAENKVDAAIQIVIVEQVGQVSCTPLLTWNKTQWRNGSEQASVSVLIHGTGTGRLRVLMKMADHSDLTSAGQYSSTVSVHVQSR